MLFYLVMGYWLLSVAIGIMTVKKIHNSRDYAIAGRHLPFYMVTATVFATWFGSETVLGISSEFLKGGFANIIADPFGSALCLILVGLFFAGPLYKMKLLTIGDYYKVRYGRKVEVITSLAIIVSYLGWVAAQITALGLVFNVISGGQISQEWGMWFGMSTVLLYTVFGGMWAVAVTDFIQMIVVCFGLLYIGYDFSSTVGGVAPVLAQASAEGKFNFFPAGSTLSLLDYLLFIGTLSTMMLGSIPQQDVFQRVQSAKNEFTAKWASVLGGVLYFGFAFIPLFIAYSANWIDKSIVDKYLESDSQMILPQIILTHAPFIVQVLFFGALLSAIKSCASATLLAPSVSLTENILKPILFKDQTFIDKKMLLTMRIVTVVFSILVTLYAMYSELSIFSMVENAYQSTLVIAFVPLVFGLYWKKANKYGAYSAITLGVITWLGLNFIGFEALQPHFCGLIAATIGMIVGSLVKKEPVLIESK